MKNLIYKLIPFLIVIIVGVIICWNPDKESILYLVLFKNEARLSITLSNKIIFISSVFILPVIILGILGAWWIEKIKKRKKLSFIILFIIWIILFFFWIFILSSTSRLFIIDPLLTI